MTSKILLSQTPVRFSHHHFCSQETEINLIKIKLLMMCRMIKLKRNWRFQELEFLMIYGFREQQMMGKVLTPSNKK